MASTLKPKLEIGLGLNKLGLDKGLKGVKSDLNGLEKTAKSATGTFGKLKSAIGGLFGKAAGFAGGLVIFNVLQKITGAFKSLVSASLDFDEAMQNVNSIAQLGSKGIANLTDEVLKLAEDPRIVDAPAVLARGLYDIVSSGFKAADAMTILRAASIAASAGLTTTDVSAAALTAVLNAYHMSADQAATVSDQLFQIVNLGVLTFDQLANTIGTVIPTAAAAGVGINELGAAYAVLTRQGVDADAATVQINAVLTGLLKPTDALTEALHGAGYESGYALLQAKGFGGALQVLNGIMQSNPELANELFGDIRQVRGILGLTTDDAELYADMLDQMGDSTKGAGATQKALSKQMQSARFQLKLLHKNVIIFFTEGIGGKFTKAMARAIGYVNHFFDSFFRARRRGVGFLDALVVGIRSTIAKIFGKGALKDFDVFVAAIKPGIMTVVGAIRFLVRTLIALLKPFRNVFHWFAMFRSKGLNPVSAGFKALGTALEHFTSKNKTLQRIVRDVGHAIAYIAQAIHDLLSGNPDKALKHIGDAFSFLWDAVKTGFMLIPWRKIGEFVWNGIVAIFDAIPWGWVGDKLWAGAQLAFNFMVDTAIPWLAGKVWGLVSGAWDAINWDAVGSTLWGGVQAAWNFVSDTAPDWMASKGKQLIDAVWNLDWGMIGGNVWAGIKTAVGAAVDLGVAAATWLAQQGWDLLKGLWNLDWNAIGTAVWNGLWSALQYVKQLGAITVEAVVQLGGDLWQIANNWVPWLKSALGWGDEGKTAELGKVTINADAGINFDTGGEGGGGLKDFLSGAWHFATDLPNKVMQALGALQGWGEAAGEFAAGIVNKILGAIAEKLSAPPAEAVAAVTKAITAMFVLAFLPVALPAILFQAIVGSVVDGFIRGFLSAEVDALKSTISGWIHQNIIDPVKSVLGISSPSTVFMGIGIQIINGLMGAFDIGRIGSFFSSIGRAIVGGMVQGIQSMWGQFVGWINALIAEAMRVRTALAISSPSKVMVDTFRQYMAGAVKGIESGMPAFARAVQRVHGTATGTGPTANNRVRPLPTMATAAGGASGGGWRTGPITINVNGANMTNDQVAEAVSRKLMQRIRSVEAAGV